MDTASAVSQQQLVHKEHLDRAYAAYEAGSYEQGIAACEAALKAGPYSAEAHNLHGILLEKLDRPRAALHAYRKAIRLDPAMDEAQGNLAALGDACREEAGDLYAQETDLLRALECCQVALEVDPTHAETHNLRGALLQVLDRPDEALAAFQRAVQLDPTLQDAAANLADLQAELADEKPEPPEISAAAQAGQASDSDLPGAARQAMADIAADEIADAGDEAAEERRPNAFDAIVSWLVSWSAALVRVLFRPTAATFRNLAADAEGKLPGGIIWLALLQLCLTGLVWVLGGRVRSLPLRASYLSLTSIAYVLLMIAISGFILRRILLCRRSYNVELTYVLIAIHAATLLPEGLLSAWLLTRPFTVLILVPLQLLAGYRIVLDWVAIKAVTRVSGWQAVAVVAGSALLSGVVANCLHTAFYIASIWPELMVNPLYRLLSYMVRW